MQTKTKKYHKFLTARWLFVLSLVAVVVLGLMPFTFASGDGGFELSLKWSGSGQNPTEYIYDSDSNESRLVRQKISYANKTISQGYAPGQIVITVPGLRAAERSGSLLPVAIAADKATESVKNYDWSYTYSSATDTFTFTNNFAIDANTTFEGSFEIIWKMASRDTKHDFEKELVAKLRTAYNEETVSAPITYSQTREKDTYAVWLTAGQMYASDGLTGALNNGVDQYTWVEYNVYSTKDIMARGINSSELYELYFPAGAIVQGAGRYARTEIVNGTVYDVYTGQISTQYTTTLILRDIMVSYPNDLYAGQAVTVYVKLLGTYYEETDQVVLAENELTTVLENYDFLDIPGDIYNVYKTSTGGSSSYVSAHCDTCRLSGAINCMHLSGGTREYYSDFYVTLNYRPEEDLVDSYDLEFVDDIMDIETVSGTLRQLRDDEYHFTKAMIKANKDVTNINNLPIEADKYVVKVFVRLAGQPDFEATECWSGHITTSAQTVTLPENSVGVKVVIYGMEESLRPHTQYYTTQSSIARVYYTFHTTDADIKQIEGRVINNMHFKLYRTYEGATTWANSGYGREQYTTQREYDRDMSLYGTALDREAYALHILEIPNELRVENILKNTGQTPTGYTFTGSITAKFTLLEDSRLDAFSIYTIVPEKMRLSELYNTPETLYEKLSFSSTKLTEGYIADHATIEIIDDYQGSGRQYIAIHFDFTDAPVSTPDITVSNFPLYTAKEDMTAYTYNFNMRAAAIYDGTGRWYAYSTDNYAIEDGIWVDIDRDGDTQERAVFSSSGVTIYRADSSNVETTKFVSTVSTEGYIQPGTDPVTNNYITSQIPYTYAEKEYSYRLRVRTGDNDATGIIFYDALESAAGSQWQGKFLRVDTAFAESKLGITPTIYYSEYEETFDPQPDLTSGNWSTEKPANVRSIAVDFGAGKLKAGEYLYIEIYMQAPADPQGDLVDLITENEFFIHYDKLESGSGEFMEHQFLPSNAVPVRLSPYMGTITLQKRDATSNETLAGAGFWVFHITSGTFPDADGDFVPNDQGEEVHWTDSRGRLTMTLPYGTYAFVEVQAPVGYIEPEDELSNYIIVELTGDEPDVRITEQMYNERKPGQVFIRKVSHLGAYMGLPGARFSVYYADGTLALDGSAEAHDLITDENGELAIDGLPWGDYYLIETETPAGCYPSTEKIPFTIEAESAGGIPLYVENEQMPASVVLTKYEVLEDGVTVTDKTLDGAAFELYMVNLFTHEFKSMGTYMTNEDGKIYIDDLAFGVYMFMETIAPRGYALNSSDELMFIVDANSTTAALEVPAGNVRLTGTAWLQKIDEKGEYVEGARYGLFRASDDTRVDVTGWPSGVDYVTNAEGILEIPGIYWGEYYLQEVVAPNGYELNPEKYYFSVNRDTVNNYIFVDATDERARGIVELTKVDEADEQITLPGAVFTLYKTDGSIYLDDLVTDQDGVLLVENLEWGNYYFLEKQAPAGYGLNPEKIRFTVNYLTAGITQTLVVTDPAVTCELTVTKTIDIDPLVFAHGNPTFTFRIDGTPLVGDPITLYRTLSFGPEYLEDALAQNAGATSLTQSLTIANLPAGVWTVTELTTVRYEQSGVSIVSGNGEVVDDNAVFTFDGAAHLAGEALFTNDKTEQSSTTHTFQTINIIKTARKMTGLVAVWNGNDVIEGGTLDRGLLDVFAVYDDGAQVKLADEAYTLSQDYFDPDITAGYTVTVSYTAEGKVWTDAFDVQVNKSGVFVWYITSVQPYTDPDTGTIYDGTACITDYLGSSTLVNFPNSVYGIRSGPRSFTDNGKTYKVTAVGQHPSVYEGYSVSWGKQCPYYESSSTRPKDSYAIGGMAGVTEIRLPAGLLKIDDWAFYNCANLTAVDIPDTVTEIGMGAFRGCTGLTVMPDLPADLVSIGTAAFYQLPGLTSSGLTLPAGVTDIGHQAFDGCTGLTGTLTLSEGLKTIGERAFKGCAGFTGSLTIPDTVQTISDYAFENCKGFNGTLTLGTVNSQLTQIGYGAFAGCNKFTGNLVIPDSVKTINGTAFENTGFTGTLTLGTENSQLDHISIHAFRDCSFTGPLIIPESVTNLSGGVFENCRGFTGNLVIPDSVTTLGAGCFRLCTGLTGTLTLGENLKTIHNEAFQYCNFTGTLTIPDGVTIIGKGAFFSCDDFTGDLVIPDSVTSIGINAFSRCTGFTGRLILGTENSRLKTIGDYAFSGRAEGHSTGNKTMNFSGALVIPDSVTSIGDFAFDSCNKITGALTIPSGVRVGDSAFAYCTGFTGLILEEGGYCVGESAFRSCTGMTGALVIPSTWYWIEEDTFAGCYGFTELVLQEGLQSIGRSAFDGCTGFEGTLTIPNSVTSMGGYTFRGCSGFTGQLVLPEDLHVLGNYTFANCTGLTGTVTLPSTLYTNYSINNAFAGCTGITLLRIPIGFSPETCGLDAGIVEYY